MDTFDVIFTTYSPLVFRYLPLPVRRCGRARKSSRRRPSTAPIPILIRFAATASSRHGCAPLRKTHISRDCRRSARTVGADALETCRRRRTSSSAFLTASQAQQIYRHVHELGAQYKEVFLLRTLGELSFRDIADIFGKSESWAKVTYFRAKNKIIERMEGST